MRTVAKNAAVLDEIPQCGAESGALGPKIGDCDPRLIEVIDAWPGLPEATKDEIAALIKAAGIGTQGVAREPSEDGGERN